MEVRKTKLEVKEVETVIAYYDECDKCKERIDVKIYDGFKFELEQRVGSSYPEGSYGTVKTMDLCQKCSDECLELLARNGYRLNKDEYDY